MATFTARGAHRIFKVRATLRVPNGKVYVEDYGLRSDGAVLRRLVHADIPGEGRVTFTSGYSLTGARFKASDMAAGRVTLGRFMRYVATRPGVTDVA